MHPAAGGTGELGGVGGPHAATGDDVQAIGGQVSCVGDGGEAIVHQAGGMIEARRAGAQRVGRAEFGQDVERGRDIGDVVECAMERDLDVGPGRAGGVDDFSAGGGVDAPVAGEHADHDAARAGGGDAPGAGPHGVERGAIGGVVVALADQREDGDGDAVDDGGDEFVGGCHAVAVERGTELETIGVPRGEDSVGGVVDGDLEGHGGLLGLKAGKAWWCKAFGIRHSAWGMKRWELRWRGRLEGADDIGGTVEQIAKWPKRQMVK